ncbi:hypothetical protein BC938DRAFT_480064 [Jimgerdemannia flammicorona]|uniref:Uncharacterized protein n=1 Tax=Jimgerdemannia flammicorona TaxID=994334 RepID=A0A433QXR4_9FUNG|nr:hypothetical protein BC938DRAFT_480064 [Jimgerdemannia flammicorona]
MPNRRPQVRACSQCRDNKRGKRHIYKSTFEAVQISLKYFTNSENFDLTIERQPKKNRRPTNPLELAILEATFNKNILPDWNTNKWLANKPEIIICAM